MLLLGPATIFIKPRIPQPKHIAPPPKDFSFFRHHTFWWYFAGTVFQSFGFFLPSLWLPTFAVDYAFPSFSGPLALAVYNVAAFLGTIAQGWMIDHYHVTVDLAIVTLVSVLAIFVCLGLATLLPMYYIFAILWGLSGGAYNATWAGYAFDLRSEGFDVDTTFIITLMVAAKGVASITSGPVSEGMYKMSLSGDAGFTYGGDYGVILVYTGVCALLGGIACLKPTKQASA